MDRTLDVQGLACPIPILQTRKALGDMRPGEIIHVLGTDPHSALDFKAFCARTGHVLLHVEESPGLFQFWIRRKP